MSKKEIEKRKEHAKLLYTVEGVTVQKELAERVGISAQSINKWVNDENWEVLRASVIMTREQELRRLYRRLTFLNDSIEQREQHEEPNQRKPITASEADALNKIAAAIRSLENDTSIADDMEAFKGLINHVRIDDFELAQSITRVADEYIKTKIARA